MRPNIPSDPDRPSTWRKFTSPKMCEGCNAGCCTLPVEMSAMDLMRLELASEEELAMSLKDTAKRLLKEKWIQKFDAKAQLFVLAQRSGVDCIFLHPTERTCTVYSKRPEVCRKFPKIGPRPGFCPEKRRPTLR